MNGPEHARLHHQPQHAAVLRLAVLLAWIALVLPRDLAAQQSADIIRGRVTGPDSAPITGVQVVAVSYVGGIEKRERTDRNGRFAIVYPNGEGSYWIVFNAIGYVQRRIELRRRGDEDVLVADMRLSKTQELQAVNVTANAARATASRSDNNQEVSGADRGLFNTTVTPNNAGNLAALAASTPGVQIIPGIDGNPDQFSIFGLPGDQNTTTLNGLVQGITRLPRDASTSLQIRSGYDVANGGASGATIAINTLSGTNNVVRTFSGLLDPPQAQWNDRVGQAAQYTSFSAGGRVSGPWALDRSFYSLAFQADRRVQELSSITAAAPAVYQSAGVDPEAVTRLRGILGDLGVPLAASSGATTSRRSSGSVLGTIDWAPKSAASGHALSLSFNGAFSDNGPAALTPLGTAASLTSTRFRNGGLLLRHTNYFGSGTLTETALSASATGVGSSPLLDLPGGQVLVTSVLGDGSRITRALGFGGGANASSSSSYSIGARNILSRFSDDNRHRFKFVSELRVDQQAFTRAANLRGRYTYQSLDDLAAGLPSSYSRTLNAVTRDASALIGAVGIGDSWRPHTDLQIQYGVRVDGNHFLTTPPTNPRLTSVLGVDNARMPNRIYVSPRVGFSWAFGGDALIPWPGGEVGGYGTATYLRGGIGLFQNVRGPEVASNVFSNTGLDSDVQQLQCTGAVTPSADWDILAANGGFGPTACDSREPGNLFANGAPSVTLFSGDYVQPRSLRSSLNWTSAVLGNRYVFTATGTYALNFNQPDHLDLNFRPQPQFALQTEAGRAVSVPPSQIDAVSGLVAAGGARVSDEFGAVSALQSSLRSRTGQIALYFQPYAPFTAFAYQLQYSYLHTWQQYRGFTSASGNPLDVQASPGSAPQHDFGLTLRYRVSNIAAITLLSRVTSGAAYTPMVAGDINGDGVRGNDRAYVFHPADASTNPAVAAGVQTLLDHGSRGARSCLRSQLGAIADRNSCRAGWTWGNSSLGIAFNTFRLGLPSNTTVSLVLANPLGAADLLLHGPNRLRGWGQTPLIDESLLYVRGFDAVRSRYQYDVNQRFGATNAAANLSRTPVALTLKVVVDLAPTRDWQQLYQSLARGRSRVGAKMSEGALRQLASTMFPDPLGNLLDRAEYVHLTRVQADSTARMSRRYKRIVDSLWTPAAKAYAALPATYDHAQAEAQLVAARDAVFGYLLTVMPHVEAMPTKGQRLVLSPLVSNYFDLALLESLRKGYLVYLTAYTAP